MNSWQLAIASAVGLLLASYFGLSYIVVAASLVPSKPSCGYQTPLGAGIPVEEVKLLTADQIRLAGWLLPSFSDRAIVMVHGLGSFGWDGATPDIANALRDAGFHVLIFDLRAHGTSGGRRLGLGWGEKQDVRAAVDLLLARGFAPGKIGIHGTSYGAATSILSAAIIPEIGAIVADSPFADVRELMDKEIEKSIGLPVQLGKYLRPGLSIIARSFFSLDLNEIPPTQAIRTIGSRPILIIHGGKDDVIPPDHSYRLRDAAGAANELWIIPGLGHTEAVRQLGQPCEPLQMSPTHDIYLSRVTKFFEDSLQ